MAASTGPEHRINDRIRAREVRLIATDGSQLGIKPLPEALQLAREAELDLVEIASAANPPVCKILDYPKYLYELKQRDKETRKKSTNVSIKEMKYRPKIGGGDFDTKTRKVSEFLSEGHKVKITIMFRGREVAHPELGMKILNRIAEIVGVAAKVEATPKLDGRNMVMVLAPEKKVAVKVSRHDDHAENPASLAGSAASPDAIDSTQPHLQTPAEPPAVPDSPAADSEPVPPPMTAATVAAPSP